MKKGLLQNESFVTAPFPVEKHSRQVIFVENFVRKAAG
jgi:hypothetical protein